ncbi:MAG TPA: hypothetical protein VMG12_13425 [Polyangiaceae bacterium]|nr:hypothetical protein [Polyangiaceae bacterium]
MSMSSVTEAPPWRHERSAAQAARRFSLRAPERIELSSADPGELAFDARRRALAPALLCPLLFALGSLPWLGPHPVGATRVATSAVCFTALAGIAAWTWPRRRRLRVAARGAGARGARAVQPSNVRWQLDAEQAPGTPRTTYSVTLQADDEALTVLQNTNPERLLWQFSEVLRHWPGPVDCRWGLPEAARPWSIEPHSGPRSSADEPATGAVVVPLSHRSLIWCSRIMAAFALADLSFLLTTAGAGLAHIHPLSVGLAVAFESCLVALTVALATGSSRLCVSRRLWRETSLFGVQRRRGDVRIESVRGVYALGTPRAERWHVLIDSADGPLALEVPHSKAAALARDAERAIAAARSGEPQLVPSERAL